MRVGLRDKFDIPRVDYLVLVLATIVEYICRLGVSLATIARPTVISTRYQYQYQYSIASQWYKCL